MSKPVTPSFADRMRQLRAERGLSIRALAKLTFHAKTYIHELETGRKQPTPQVAQRIDDALDAGGVLTMLAASQPDGVRRRDLVAAAGFAAVLPHTLLVSGRKVGADVPQQLLDRTARLRRIDDYLGGIDTYPMYATEVESTMRLVREGSYTEATGRSLLSVLAEQAQMAGWAAFDGGRQDDADRLYRLSLDAARDSADEALAANAFAFLAYGATGRTATETAAAACDAAGTSATPRVRLLLHTRAAWAYAVSGHAADAAAHLGIGAAALADDDERPEPDWVYWVDQVELEIMTGRCWTVLHRPVRAIPALERALSAYEDTHGRDKALYLLWLADAYLDANEIEHACVAVRKAMKLAAGVGSVRPGGRLQAVFDRLDPHAALPCVADLKQEAREWGRRRRTVATTSGKP
ncbi:hypothetical protein GCM10027290_41090 [Micromonospora sonneratiae]|uniref:Helix-turn-helix domain-containing protein n=1 Tax=Micromonospora sonneratiae TaxID=1184706 RepID=A0ABW3YQ74_9ACTN